MRQPAGERLPGLLRPLRRRRVPPAARRTGRREQGRSASSPRGPARSSRSPRRHSGRCTPGAPPVGPRHPVPLQRLPPCRRPPDRRTDRPGHLRLRRRGPVAGARRAALAPLRDRPPAGVGRPPRRAGALLPRCRPAVLREGRRVPAARPGPLPRRRARRRSGRSRRPHPAGDHRRDPARGDHLRRRRRHPHRTARRRAAAARLGRTARPAADHRVEGVRRRGRCGQISEARLAGYVAKYATKGTGTTEGADRPIRDVEHIAYLDVSPTTGG